MHSQQVDEQMQLSGSGKRKEEKKKKKEWGKKQMERLVTTEIK